MTCQEFWKRLEKPPGAGSDLGSDLHTHLSACPACSTGFERQRELATGLRLLAERYTSLKAPARVEARLMHAFRSQNGIVEPVGKRRWAVPLCWAAAAALLLAAGVFVGGRRQPAPPRMSPAPAELMAVVGPDSATPDADGFIPLPNAERLAPTDDADDVDMVRMEVPRSTLVAMGLTLTADRVPDQVEADVLLGPDGMARAVRILD